MMKAKSLNFRSTGAGNYLWPYLNSCPLSEYQFKRFVSIGDYVVDFICTHKKLIIELDDGQHVINREYDEIRTDYLNSLGYKVLHFWNDEIIMKIESVIESITLSLQEYS